MIPQKLLIVAQKFWPHCGLTELSLADLACNLVDGGHQVTVATVKWSRDWSDQINFRGVRIVRFARPVSGPWTSYRYARALARHFSAHRYDGIIASGLGDETAAVAGSADEYTPVVIRVDDGMDGVKGQLHRRHVETALSADAIVTNSHAVAQRMGEVEQMPPARIIADGIRLNGETPRSRECKLQLRRALSEAHPVLKIDPDQPLMVSSVRLNRACGYDHLIQAWTQVLSRFPRARLWLIGEGKWAENVWQQIVRLDLMHSVMMPGYFDDLNDVISAADLYLHPCLDQQSGEGLLRAMSVGTPVIACRNQVTESLIRDGFNGQLIPADRMTSVAKPIVHLLANPQAAHQTRINAVQTIARDFTPADQVRQYLQALDVVAREPAVVQ